jgi:hypothetical protein
MRRVLGRILYCKNATQQKIPIQFKLSVLYRGYLMSMTNMCILSRFFAVVGPTGSDGQTSRVGPVRSVRAVPPGPPVRSIVSARTPRNYTRARFSGRNRKPACAYGRKRKEAPEIETRSLLLHTRTPLHSQLFHQPALGTCRAPTAGGGHARSTRQSVSDPVHMAKPGAAFPFLNVNPTPPLVVMGAA